MKMYGFRKISYGGGVILGKTIKVWRIYSYDCMARKSFGEGIEIQPEGNNNSP